MAMQEKQEILTLQELHRARRKSLEAVSSIVFHDLNQPLTYLLANATRFRQLAPGIAAIEKLLQDPTNPIPPSEKRNLKDLCFEYDELVSELQEGCEDLREQLGGLRSLSQPSGEQSSAALDIAAAVHHACEPYVAILLEQNLNLEIEESGTPPKALLPKESFTHIVFHFVMNAIQAQASYLKILVRDLDNGRVEIQFKNNAKDTPPIETLPKNFMPTAGEHGPGAGLFEVRRLLQRYGGKMKGPTQDPETGEVSLSIQLRAER